MSKATVIQEYWVMAKKAMLIGLGYFAVTDPKGTGKFLWRVVPPLAASASRDTYLVVKAAAEELVRPALLREYQSGLAAAEAASAAARAPMIWGGLAQPAFIMIGGTVAHTISIATEDLLELLWEGSSGAPRDPQLVR